MLAPGVDVQLVDGAASSAGVGDTGTAFIVGLTERGPADTPIEVRSLSHARSLIGGRVNYGTVYDALDVFFREGGSRAFVGRIVGPGAEPATADLETSGSDATLTVTAVSPGDWGNDIEVTVGSGVGGGYTLTVEYDGDVVEVSPEFASNAEAVEWAARSAYIRLEDLEKGNPATGTEQLASGTDDRGNITTTEISAALALLDADLGPGQVLYPGATDTTNQELLLAHARDNRRVALLDGDNSPTAGDLLTDAATLRATGLGRYGALFAPWGLVAGDTPGTTRLVPWSAVQAGIIARNEAAGLNQNTAAAGPNGVSRVAVGLAQPPWSEAQRGELNEAGVNVALDKPGGARTFGFRTLANPVTESNWRSLASSRLAMSIAYDAEQIAERFMFAQLDGRGHTLGEFQGELLTMLNGYYNSNALHGSTAEEAFRVDVGPGVNPPQDLAEGKLSAAILVRMSPFAEFVQITITKVPTEEAL